MRKSSHFVEGDVLAWFWLAYSDRQLGAVSGTVPYRRTLEAVPQGLP